MNDWTSFEDEVASNCKGPGARCHVARMFEELPEEAIVPVKKALANRQLSAASLAKTLGDKVGDRAPKQHSISAHRRGDCRCPKEK